jgi:DtxR family transcriptional regulator, Mn-dependent transcriptional regulator
MKKAAAMVDDLPEGLSASLEDYLEVIHHLERSNRVARAKDIADQMNVQRASVTGALKALAGRGLINYSPYSYITLTAAGRTVAQDIIHRHETLKEFFIAALQLDAEDAEANACRVEHAIDPSAVDRLVRFLEFIKMCPRTGLDWFSAFARYCQKGTQTSNCEDCLRVCLDRIIVSENNQES